MLTSFSSGQYGRYKVGWEDRQGSRKWQLLQAALWDKKILSEKFNLENKAKSDLKF